MGSLHGFTHSLDDQFCHTHGVRTMSTVSDHFVHSQHHKPGREDERLERDNSRIVYVIDDDEAPRHAISMLIQRRLEFAVISFSSAEEFLDHYDGSTSGCIVTDYRLAGMNGLELQERLHARGIHLPFIFVSGYADVPVTVRAMRNGAVTLLKKPWNDEQLTDAVSEAIRLEAQWRVERSQLQAAQRRLSLLTSQEREVVEMVIAGKSNKQISYAMDVSLRTIERRRQSIFTKTQTNSAVELAGLARQAGYHDMLG